MNSKRLMEIRQLNQKYLKSNAPNNVARLVRELLNEIDRLQIDLDLTHAVVTDYADTIRNLRAQLLHAKMRAEDEDIENPYASR